MTADAGVPEFSRPIDLDRVGEGELRRDIAATPEECAALAKRFGIAAIGRLGARVRLRRERAGTVIRLSADIEAEVTQTCVVTLAPVQNRIQESFTLLYGDVPGGAAVDVEADEEDTVEPLPEGPLDIGEAVAQELALALDPYPKAPGAELEPAWQAPDAVAEKVNPFAGLDKLRRRLT